MRLSQRRVRVGTSLVMPLLLGSGVFILAGSATRAPANAEDERLLGKLEGTAGVAVAFSRDVGRICTADEKAVRVWDGSTFKPVTEPLQHGAALRFASISLDGARLLTVGGDSARTWDAETGKPLLQLRHKGVIWSASFSPDGSKLVTGADDKAARVYDAATGRLLLTREHPAAVYLAAFSADGRKVMSVARGDVDDRLNYAKSAVYLWDAATGRQLLHDEWKAVDDWPGDWDPPWVRPASLTADGGKLACVVFKGVTVWEPQTGKVLASINLWGAGAKRHLGTPSALTFSADGKHLITAGHGAAVWETTGNNRLVCVLSSDAVRSAEFSPDGRRVLIAADSADTGVWDVASEKQVLSVRGPYLDPPTFRTNRLTPTPVVAFSPDGTRIAVSYAAEGSTTVWRVEPKRQE